MVDNTRESMAAQRVRHAVAGIDSLAELSALVAEAVGVVCQTPFSAASLASAAERSPALASRILWLAWQQGIDPADRRFSTQRILEKIRVDSLRDAVLSLEADPGTSHNTTEDGGPALSRRDLVLHSVAVAFAARRIAEASPAGIDPDMAYLAGLLHDVGKLAFQQVMPKGFDSIVEQAKASGQAGYVQERELLGTDHAALGRLLAERWHFPSPLATAIWLHHSPGAAASLADGGSLAQLINLADALARATGLAPSGSFDHPVVTGQIAESLELDPGVLRAISARVAESIQITKAQLGWDDPEPWRRLSDAARSAALRLGRRCTQLAEDQGKLQAASGQMTFVRDFLTAVAGHTTVVDLAEDLAKRWQRVYQTGKVCVVLAWPEDGEAPEAAIVEGLGASRRFLLEGSGPWAWQAELRGKDFGVLPGGPFLDELTEQTATPWDPSRVRWVPLSFGRQPFGMILFELNYPADTDRFVEHFRFSAQVAATGLYLMMARQRHQRIGEDLVGLVPETGVPEPQTGAEDLLEALVEVVAGFAHELNNPLAVISGRAQLLAETQVDESARRSLNQIQEQVHQVSALVEGLMDYAAPAPAHKELTSIGQILDEARGLASLRLAGAELDIHVEIAQDVSTVFADSAQAASSLSNILVNAFESYANGQGHVEVSVERDSASEHALIRVRDHGCGMDAETLRKATLPFFSAKPAGRKRGLGLAFADRLMRLNDGRLQITSVPGAGATVTLTLPLRPL